MKCVICNNSLEEKCIVQSDDDCIVLNGDCNHDFHKTCLEIWFRRIHEQECPLCKKDFILTSYIELC